VNHKGILSYVYEREIYRGVLIVERVKTVPKYQIIKRNQGLGMMATLLATLPGLCRINTANWGSTTVEKTNMENRKYPIK